MRPKILNFLLSFMPQIHPFNKSQKASGILPLVPPWQLPPTPTPPLSCTWVTAAVSSLVSHHLLWPLHAVLISAISWCIFKHTSRHALLQWCSFSLRTPYGGLESPFPSGPLLSGPSLSPVPSTQPRYPLSVFKRHQANALLEAFPFGLHSGTFFPHLTPSLTSFRSRMKYHFSARPHPGTTSAMGTFCSSPPSFVSPWHLLSSNFPYILFVCWFSPPTRM